MDGVVVTINIVTFLLPTPGNFRIKIAEILFNQERSMRVKARLRRGPRLTRSTRLTPS
jgi:hypothetical protein